MTPAPTEKVYNAKITIGLQLRCLAIWREQLAASADELIQKYADTLTHVPAFQSL